MATENKPLVSICIPTYNRYEHLKMTIDSIVEQREFLDGRVEIVINDNASDDKTSDIGKEYSTKYENVLYYRNTENVKDKNFPICLSRANGVLRKLNNDTFRISKDGLKILCAIADKYKDEKPQVFLTNNRKKIKSDKEESFHDFLIEEGFWVTWISSFTIWDTDCMYIADDTDGCELQLWQVKKFYELASIKNKVIVCDANIGTSVTPTKKNLSYGLYQVFYTNYLSLVKPYLNQGIICDDDFDTIERNLLYDFFIQWVINWEMNRGNMVYSDQDKVVCISDIESNDID